MLKFNTVLALIVAFSLIEAQAAIECAAPFNKASYIQSPYIAGLVDGLASEPLTFRISGQSRLLKNSKQEALGATRFYQTINFASGENATVAVTWTRLDSNPKIKLNIQPDNFVVGIGLNIKGIESRVIGLPYQQSVEENGFRLHRYAAIFNTGKEVGELTADILFDSTQQIQEISLSFKPH